MQALQNPEAAMQQMINQYPQLQGMFSELSSHNMSFEQFANILAQRNGVNLNDLIQELQS